MAGTLMGSDTTGLVVEDGPKLRTRTSLASIVVGMLVAIGAGIILHLLATAVGLASIDTTERDTPSGTTIALLAGGWGLVANLLAFCIGGYVAARLSGNTDRQDAALHGLGVWGSAVGITFLVGGIVAAGMATATTSAVGSMVGGALRGAGAVAAATAPAGDAASRPDPAALVDRLRATLAAPNDPQAMNTEQRGAEMAALLGRRVMNNGFAPGERERLSSLIAAEAGISPADAEARIAAYEQQAREAAARAEQRAREAADAAAAASAIAAFWMFAALMIGAAGAVIGALQGARDGVLLVRPASRIG